MEWLLSGHLNTVISNNLLVRLPGKAHVRYRNRR